MQGSISEYFSDTEHGQLSHNTVFEAQFWLITENCTTRISPKPYLLKKAKPTPTLQECRSTLSPTVPVYRAMNSREWKIGLTDSLRASLRFSAVQIQRRAFTRFPTHNLVILTALLAFGSGAHLLAISRVRHQLPRAHDRRGTGVAHALVIVATLVGMRCPGFSESDVDRFLVFAAFCGFQAIFHLFFCHRRRANALPGTTRVRFVRQSGLCDVVTVPVWAAARFWKMSAPIMSIICRVVKRLKRNGIVGYWKPSKFITSANVLSYKLRL